MQELFEETMTTISPNLIKVRSWWTESPRQPWRKQSRGSSRSSSWQVKFFIWKILKELFRSFCPFLFIEDSCIHYFIFWVGPVFVLLLKYDFYWQDLFLIVRVVCFSVCCLSSYNKCIWYIKKKILNELQILHNFTSPCQL